MKYLLDTNVCIALLRGRIAALKERVSSIRADEAVVPSVVRYELLYGARKSDRPSRIDSTFLTQFSSFQDFREKSEHASTSDIATDANSVDTTAVEEVHGTPDEIIHAQTAVLNAALRKDLAEQVLAMDPDQFEQLVVDLLVAMGYGGSVVDAGRAIGRSNDGGIDGERLANLMIQFNLGVSVAETILLKELDYDYFGN